MSFETVRAPCIDAYVSEEMQSIQVWHRRLGHANTKRLIEMAKNSCVTGMNVTDQKESFCEACVLGKKHKIHFKITPRMRATAPGKYVHSDVCGPMLFVLCSV